MANNKTGFNYWNVDTDRYQDIKIKRLKKAFSTAGIAVYDYVVNEIYRVKGCFLEWDNSTAFDVADYFDLKEVLVNEIVSYCGVVGLFEKGLLSGENVITSRSIQMRFVEMTIRANRNLIIIPEEYNILSEEYKVITEEHNIKYQQSNRVKKSKVKKSKEDDYVKEEPTPTISNFFNPILDLAVEKDLLGCAKTYFGSSSFASAVDILCMNYQVEAKTINELKHLAVAFNAHCALVGKVKRSTNEWGEHFKNWLLDPKRKKITNESNTESPEQRRERLIQQSKERNSGASKG